jgi:hypothetical protein
MQYDMISRLDVRNLWPDLTHDATSFVTQQVWQIPVRPFNPINLTQLRTANPAYLYFYKDLAKAERRQLDLIDHEWLMLLEKYGRKRFHGTNQK